MWYLAKMDYIVGCFKTKREALQSVGALHFRCHRRSYGYSVDVKDESDGWHQQQMWLFNNRESAVKHGFSEQLTIFEEEKNKIE